MPEDTGRDGPDYEIEEVEIDPRLDPAVQKQIIQKQAEATKRGQIIGAIVIVIGAVLILLGATGTVDVTFKSGTTQGKFATGSAGAFVVAVGAAIIYFTRFKVTATGGGAASGGRRKGGQTR